MHINESKPKRFMNHNLEAHSQAKAHLRKKLERIVIVVVGGSGGGDSSCCFYCCNIITIYYI
jgi:tRNA(Ile)-lysidine synthase TilS/MesJ